VAAASLRSSSTGVETSNTTSWAVSYPATIVAGDLLLLTIGCDGTTRSFSGLESGWTSLKSALTDGSCSFNAFYKIATGSESGLIGTGATNITCSSSEQGAWRLGAFQDWFGTAAGIAISTGASGASSGPDPDSLTLPWGSGEDTLVRAVGASDGSVTVTGYPSGYTLNQFADHSGGGAGAGMFSAGIVDTGSPVNPGAFTLSGSDGWAAATIAIRPAAAVAYEGLPQRVAPRIVPVVPVQVRSRW